MNSLLIITGAGASHDVVDESWVPKDERFKPPLTKNLFRPPTFISDDIPSEGEESSCILECLRRNPVAAMVGMKYLTLSAGSKEKEKSRNAGEEHIHKSR